MWWGVGPVWIGKRPRSTKVSKTFVHECSFHENVKFPWVPLSFRTHWQEIALKMNVIYLFFGGRGAHSTEDIRFHPHFVVDLYSRTSCNWYYKQPLNVKSPTEQISLEERFTGPNGARSRGHVVTYSHPQRHSSFMYCLGLIVSTRAERSWLRFSDGSTTTTTTTGR